MRAKLIPGVLTLALAGMTAEAQQRPRMDGLMACRADMEALCGSDRADRPKVRQCIIENRDKVSEDCKRALDAMRNGPGAGAMPTVTVSYGNDARQAIDFYRAKDAAGPAPLIVFIHGGAGDKRQASGRKPAHFTAAGYAFASINYRLALQATVDQQASDVASAVDMLRFRAEDYGIDPNRIALMGHGAGARLAALVATDPKYMKLSDVPISAVKAVVLLDDAAAPKVYGLTLPPTSDAAAWLALYVEGRETSAGQSWAVGEAQSGNGDLNQNLGMAGDAATAEVDAFLKVAL